MTSQDVVVRDAGVADADAIARLLGQLGYPTTPDVALERMRAATQDGNGRVIVAQAGGEVNGVITVYHIRTIHRPGEICRITALVVEETMRGAGFGRMLLEAIESHARTSGCIRVEVTSAAPRTAAHEFYLRNGYAEYPKRFIKDL